MNNTTDKKTLVAVEWVSPKYPKEPPFDPNEPGAEFPFPGCASREPEAQSIYSAVRQAMAGIGLDAANLDTPGWNPLASLVPRGGQVLIKPNIVVSEHDAGHPGLLATVASPSVYRPLIDAAYLAVGPKGRIIVADSPIKEVNFEKVTRAIGLRAMVDELRSRGVPVELVDLRDLKAVRDSRGTIVRTELRPGDPKGYVTFDLGRESMFGGLTAEQCRRLRSTASVYEDEASRNHTPDVNRYTVSGSLIASDLVISVAKLKSHRKAGMTAALKNLVGMTNEKRWLPHHRFGSPADGGDMYPDGAPLERRLREALSDWLTSRPEGRIMSRVLKPPLMWAYGLRKKWMPPTPSPSDIGEGNWWGNDTIWRTTLDLNVLLKYGTKDGRVAEVPQRRYLAVIDAVLCGDGEGPLHPAPREVGAIILGRDPVACDVVAARIAGFDHEKIPTIARASEVSRPLGTNDPQLIEVVSLDRSLSVSDLPSFGFAASRGWKGDIESSHLPGQGEGTLGSRSSGASRREKNG